MGTTVGAAGTRYHPLQHGPLPGPDRDQHRGERRSTLCKASSNRIRAGSDTFALIGVVAAVPPGEPRGGSAG
jgi:hypothetical protein